MLRVARVIAVPAIGGYWTEDLAALQSRSIPVWERYTLYAFSGIDTTYTDYYTANQEHIIERVLVGDSTAGYMGDINTNKAYKFEAALLSAKDMGYTNELTNDLI